MFPAHFFRVVPTAVFKYAGVLAVNGGLYNLLKCRSTRSALHVNSPDVACSN